MREPLGIWEIADAYPHRMAVHTTEGQSLSFGELCARVNRLSRCLRDLGLTPGAFIVVVAGNAVDVLALQLATLQLNAYFVPLDIRWTGVEVSETLRTLRPAIFAVDGFAAEAGKQAEGIVRPAGGVRMSRVEVIIELANTYPSCALADRKYGETVFHTSGSTGRPRAVVRPLKNETPEVAIARFLPGLVSLYDLSFPDGRHLVTSSLAAVGPNAAAIRALHIGHTVVALPRFSVKSLLGAIQAHRITSLHAVPTLLEIALGFPEDMRSAVDVSSLRSIVLVGAKCPIDTKRAIVDWWGPIVHEVYSSTEVGMTHISSPEWLARPGSVGRPIAGSHLRIVNEQGGDCPAFTVGRIYMKRDGDTFEYWNDPESTRSAHLGEYVTVGDEGFVDRDGWLYLAGRAIERINSGAIKFYPSEVEDVLLGDPDVIRAAVFGTASRHMGEVVVAIVELDASTTLAAVKSRLFERCRARLARPKWPVRILSATLPTLPSGKVDRLQTRRLISPDSDTTIDPPATGG